MHLDASNVRGFMSGQSLLERKIDKGGQRRVEGGKVTCLVHRNSTQSYSSI